MFGNLFKKAIAPNISKINIWVDIGQTAGPNLTKACAKYWCDEIRWMNKHAFGGDIHDHIDCLHIEVEKGYIIKVLEGSNGVHIDLCPRTDVCPYLGQSLCYRHARHGETTKALDEVLAFLKNL